MKTIKELEEDMKLALGISNKKWITQLVAKLQDREDVLKLIDDYEHGKIKSIDELKAGIEG